jgi:subtilisin family serine protease
VDCTNGDGSFNDLVGHGSIVGGDVGALDNGYGRVGVAPGANLYSVRVLDKHNSATTARIMCGIDWVTATRADSDPSNDMPVANMSIVGQTKNADDGNCGRTNKDALHLAICNSVAAGVTYVVAAGNTAKDIKDDFPAAYDEVLAATAMTDTDGKPGGVGPLFPLSCRVSDAGTEPDDAFASFSNFATLAADQAHTIAAPGVCIGSTYLDGGYAVGSGTSFASPLVAGTIALCVFSGPCAGLTPPQIVQEVVADAASYNTASKNFGYGFQGDPLRPISGKYYGYLIRAGLY